MKAALDAVVIKQGIFNLVFHPYGWIKHEQVVELIDHAVTKHGRKVKFLNFREALERLNKNLLAGQPLRAADGEDNGVRLIDLNADGDVDVVIGNEQLGKRGFWSPAEQCFATTDFPVRLVNVVDGRRRDVGSAASASCRRMACRPSSSATNGQSADRGCVAFRRKTMGRGGRRCSAAWSSMGGRC